MKLVLINLRADEIFTWFKGTKKRSFAITLVKYGSYKIYRSKNCQL